MNQVSEADRLTEKYRELFSSVLTGICMSLYNKGASAPKTIVRSAIEITDEAYTRLYLE